MEKTWRPPILTISTARQKFFSLFESVTGHRGRKVVITSRGSENHAVLVGEAYLNELEAAAKRLRDIESGRAKPAVDFKLGGNREPQTAGQSRPAHIRTRRRRPVLNLYSIYRFGRVGRGLSQGHRRYRHECIV
jgi:PHD/YefM family antitoxin component YafN of YafNO toxin-antitoxin module